MFDVPSINSCAHMQCLICDVHLILVLLSLAGSASNNNNNNSTPSLPSTLDLPSSP